MSVSSIDIALKKKLLEVYAIIKTYKNELDYHFSVQRHYMSDTKQRVIGRFIHDLVEVGNTTDFNTFKALRNEISLIHSEMNTDYTFKHSLLEEAYSAVFMYKDEIDKLKRIVISNTILPIYIDMVFQFEENLVMYEEQLNEDNLVCMHLSEGLRKANTFL